MPKRFYKNIVELALFWGFSTVVRLLPSSLALALGSGLGTLSRFLVTKPARTARANLRRTFPEMPTGEIEATVAAVFRHLGKTAVEMLRLDQMKEDDLEGRFEFIGLEHLRAAYAQNKGVLLLTGHIGFWEAGTFFLPQLGFPADFVAKRMKNPYVDRYVTRLREAKGGQCLESRHGARKIIRSLARNRGVAILLDQHIVKHEAVEVDFFGRPAYTTPIIAQIAMKYGAPVVPIYVYRTEDNRYRVEIQPIIDLQNDPAPEAVIRNTQRLTDSIEAAVRKDITQWFWVHRRWRDG